MKDLVGPMRNHSKPITLLMDYRIPTFYNANFTKNVSIISIFDNLNDAQNTQPQHFDYIAFFKKARMMQPDSSIRKEITHLISNLKQSRKKNRGKINEKQQKIFSNWLQSANIVRGFMKTHILKGAHYKKIYEDKNFLFFKISEEKKNNLLKS